MSVYFICGEVVSHVVICGENRPSQGNSMCKGMKQDQVGGECG